ncbi:hypothetical protein D187_004793 [Cystobacter fuscus DSM 2262]|uniref:Uncharacterized protein n=1 Tax=Cystobacter fuscus (strain ATCC 25194 / DSM 2262 / NBRC 100088 / M29) TaxID=1242864 RepID=S9Q8L0_CYSF2|nr:hypothetical protein D187_004793 [Cystobacter fuscus DSM 2262]
MHRFIHSSATASATALARAKGTTTRAWEHTFPPVPFRGCLSPCSGVGLTDGPTSPRSPPATPATRTVGRTPGNRPPVGNGDYPPSGSWVGCDK